MLAFEKEMPFFMPHLFGQRGDGERLATDLVRSAKMLFGDEVLQNMRFCLEDHLARMTTEQASQEQASKEPQPSTSSKPDQTGDSACSGGQASTSHSCQQFPTFGDLLQKVDEFLKKEFQPKEQQSDQKSEATEDKKPEVASQDIKKSEEKQSSDIIKQTLKNSGPKEIVKDFEFRVKAADFKPEDIHVKVKDGFVTVEALREEQDEENGTFRMQKLHKQIQLPSGINPDLVSCEMSEGFLTIKAPLPSAIPEVNRERVLMVTKEIPKN